MRALWEQGLSQIAIAQRTQMDRRTGCKFLRTEVFPERKERTSSRQPRLLDRYASYLRCRWETGCHNTVQLIQELRKRGYAGGDNTTVKDFFKGLRHPDQAGSASVEKRLAPRQMVA